MNSRKLELILKNNFFKSNVWRNEYYYRASDIGCQCGEYISVTRNSYDKI